MKRSIKWILILLAGLGLALGLVACTPGKMGSDQISVIGDPLSVTNDQVPVISGQSTVISETPAATCHSPYATPYSTAAIPPSPTPQPPGSPTPQSPTSLFPSPTPTPLPCSPEVCIFPGHFWLARPILPPGHDEIDRTYPYGSTQEGQREIHHGVEMVNSPGTPVTAAAAGTVIVAGDDHHVEFYSNWHHFYGNLVIIEHDFPELGQPLFTLYAHLSEIQTEVGAVVQTGEQIGLVGSSGSADGSHLHFEVRLGANEYDSTRNPELWLLPNPDETGQPRGVLIGRLIDKYGDPIYIPGIVVEQLGSDERILETFYVETYADKSVNGDDQWMENFAIGDLPAGMYRVSFVERGMRIYMVEVLPGLVTQLMFDGRELED
jgi:murein DD-endopeptidase MepM/ murein hydrolase activator NlpD